MRKVKNNINVNNPAVMFAQGLESLIADPLLHPSRHDEQEISETRRASHKREARGNPFGVLLRQFANL